MTRLSKKMVDAINKQINAELYSAYLYLAMRAWFDSINLPGAAGWMKVQALEEQTHADRFYKYLVDRAVPAKMTPIDGPETEWASPLAAFEAVAAHEKKVTGLINDLVNLAAVEKDHATVNMLQWFVAEQVEEEASAAVIVEQLKLIADSKGALFMLDRELGKREFKS